jgi:predicted kinase
VTPLVIETMAPSPGGGTMGRRGYGGSGAGSGLSIELRRLASASYPRAMQLGATLIVFSGLPGAGKSSLAREIAWRLGALWLRIDSIETAIKTSGVVRGSIEDAGYRAAYAIAEDNLRLGRRVVGDCVNPWMETRDAWRNVGLRAGARVLEIETICSDGDERRRRVETRVSEIAGHVPPTWVEVADLDYRPWDRAHLVIDTAGRHLTSCVDQALLALTR